MRPILILPCLLFFGAVCFAKNEQTPEQFLQKLYQGNPTSKPPIDLTKKENLNKYFDGDLVRLFLKDFECQKKSGGICNLDFDPIYDAQDMEAKTTNLKVSKVKGQGEQFAVTFTNIDTRTLIYTLKNTKEGWRISDIKYPQGPSLKEILSRKMP
jgi:hypothetical protein